MKDVQCYELFGGIALKNHAFSFHLYWINARLTFLMRDVHHDVHELQFGFSDDNDTSMKNFHTSSTPLYSIYCTCAIYAIYKLRTIKYLK